MESSTELLAAAAAGVVAHRGVFIKGEWHMQAPMILIVHMVIYNALWLMMIAFRHAAVLQAVGQASIISGCYLSSLFTSMLVYRLMFHRLRDFPGPVLARSTKLWHAWKGRRSQNHLLLDQLHHQYGDFVRTGRLICAESEISTHAYVGPSELTIFDATAFAAVNGLGTKCTKSVWYDFMQPNYSIISSRSHHVHDKRRRVWSPALSANGKACGSQT